MKKLSCITTQIVGNLPTLSLYIQLKTAWKEVVGEKLSNFLQLKSIKYTNKNELTIVIKTLSAASLMIQNSSTKIKKSISDFLGISDIKLVFQHTSVLEPLSETRSSPIETTKSSDVQIHHSESLNMSFKNKGLKTALEKLKVEMQNAA